MRRFFVTAVLLIASLSAARADCCIQNPDNMPIAVLSRTADDMPLARIPDIRTYDGQKWVQANPQIPTPLPPIVVSPPSNFDQPVVTVSTATPKESVAFGDYAGSILNWLVVLLIPVLSPLAVDWYVKFRARLGLQTTDAQRDKFQQIIENGVALGAHDAQASLAGKMNFEVKNQVMAQAVAYAKTHGADTIKLLGLDPTSPEAEEAIRARAAKVMQDAEAALTPAVVAPVAPPAAVA